MPYLTPAALPAPLYDDALDDLFQGLLAGITGLPGDLVRPRYQRKPPKQPAADVTWCAVGVMDIDPDAGPALDVDQVGALVRHETLHVLASFYGPNASAAAAQARDGLTLPQNAVLQLMTYVNSDTMRKASELVNEQWIQRIDLPMQFRRQVKRAYSVQTILAADVVRNPD